MWFLTIVILCILWYFVELWKVRRISIASKQFIKCSAISLPLVGHGHIFAGSGQRRMMAFKKLSEEALKNGSNFSAFWLGFDFYVFVVDPDGIDMLSKKCLEKAQILRFARHLTGNGSLFAPVNIWRPRRKIMIASFSQRFLNSFFKVFSELSMKTTTKLDVMADGNDFSIWPMLVEYSMEAIWDTTLGMKSKAQAQCNDNFLKSFEIYCDIISERILSPWLYVDAIFKMTNGYERAEKHKKIMITFINEIIEFKREEIRKNTTLKKTKEEPVAILDHLLETQEGITNKELLEEILVLVLAATDTSTVAASFATVMMSRNLDIQRKVYQEVREVMGPTNRPLELTDMPKLKYLEAMIKETLRLYPSVPIVVRGVDEDTTLPSGLTFVKGTNVMFSIWGIHRHPKYWGDDAEKFNPDRFMNGSTLHPGAYIPFSNGPRNCIGYKYAMLSMKTLLATIISQFEVLPATNTDSGSPLRLQCSIMLKHTDNFKVKLKRR